NAMRALLVGKPLGAMRAEDIARGVDLLAARADVDSARIYGFGKSNAAIPMLYAAAFDERLRRVALESMLVSYEAVVANRLHRGVFESIVPGALKFFDLPDLVAALAPRPVWLVNPVNAMGYRAGLAEVGNQYARARAAFRAAGAESAVRIERR